MNFVEKLLWRWQGKSKLNSDQVGLKYTGIRKLGEIANPGDFDILINELTNSNQTLRNAAALAIREIIEKTEDPIKLDQFKSILKDKLSSSQSLPEKIAVVEVLRALDLDFRVEMLADQIVNSQNDLQYVVIKSLQDTSDLDILDDVLEASNTSDLVLRRIALLTWYDGLANQEIADVIDYITPRMHYLVRAVYELQTDGEFLRTALSHAPQKQLPVPKAYPDFMIRYMTELLGNWSYDPEAFRSLHAIMVPSYFTFEDGGNEDERPYVML